VIDELALAAIALAAAAMISCLSAENPRHIRLLPRAAWIITILFLPIAGPAAWFLSGRPRPQPRESRRASAPDDDPGFLNSLPPPQTRPHPPGRQEPGERTPAAPS
jgi:hypothetical protein